MYVYESGSQFDLWDFFLDSCLIKKHMETKSDLERPFREREE